MGLLFIAILLKNDNNTWFDSQGIFDGLVSWDISSTASDFTSLGDFKSCVDYSVANSPCQVTIGVEHSNLWGLSELCCVCKCACWSISLDRLVQIFKEHFGFRL
jgi:hypothetical protein